MESYLKMGLNLLEIARRFGVRVIYNLTGRVKSEIFLPTLTGMLNDDSAWIIDSSASRY